MAKSTYQHKPLPRLFFDLETKGNPTSFEFIKPAKAPANYVDPVKIAKFIEDARLEAIEKAPLDPDYGQIVSVGYSLGPDEPIITLLVGDEITTDFRPTYVLDEAELVQAFWQQFTECNGRAVGFNVLSFDLPYLLARSMHLGIKVPLLPQLAKFRMEPITDLFAIRYGWGPGKSFKLVCRMLGIDNPLEGVDGSMVKDMSRDEIRAYQHNDIWLLQHLFKRMNGIYFVL